MKKVYVFIQMVVLLFASVAFANQDLTGVTIDLTSVEILLGIVLTAMLAIFGYRKFIRTANRS